MTQVILEVARYYVREKSEYDNIPDAARFAVDLLEAGEHWPVSITEDGVEIWRQNGPLGDCIEKLEELASEVKWTY